MMMNTGSAKRRASSGGESRPQADDDTEHGYCQGKNESLSAYHHDQHRQGAEEFDARVDAGKEGVRVVG